MPGQKCSICIHPHKAEIEQALQSDTPYRNVAAQYDTSTGALQRHKAHMVTSLAETNKPIPIKRAPDMVDSLFDLKKTLDEAMASATAQGNVAAIAMVSRELRGVIDTLLKVAVAQREIDSGHKDISQELETLLEEIIA